MRFPILRLEFTRLVNSKYISLLLIALVIQCPFQCIFGGCFANEIGGGITACSSCCNHSSQPVDDCEEPSHDASDCNCGDCFCRGALPVNDISDDLIVAELVSFMTFWVKLETTTVALPTSQVQHSSIVLSVDATPLEVRAALCCWVI
jgi:hypothetical protein